MAKKASKPKLVEDKQEGQEEPETRNAHGRRMPATKTEAVQMAIAAGFDSPQVGSGYIQSQFGLDVSPQHFSSTKSQLKSKILAGKPTPKPDAPAKHSVGPKALSNGESDLLTAMEAMKPLVASLGAEKVKRIVDLLG